MTAENRTAHYKYVMKSIHHGKAGANSKLRGKKTAVLSCRCCMLFNPKWDERMKEAKLEIRRKQNGID
jgi:hypothetical protein